MFVKSKQLIMKSVVGVLLGLSLFVLPGWAQTGVIVTVAGNGRSGISITSGSATSEPLNQPGGIFCDAVGNIYFSDSWNNRICKVDTLGGFSIVAGTGMLAGTGWPERYSFYAKINQFHHPKSLFRFGYAKYIAL